jgi:hypothetical protein
MEVVADDQQLADELHGDLAVAFVRSVAEPHFIGKGFCVVIEFAGMGAAARTPCSFALDGEPAGLFRFRDANDIDVGAPFAEPIPHRRWSCVRLPQKPVGLDPADRLSALARLKPTACELAERLGNNDFVIGNDISFQTTGLVVGATLVGIAVEIDSVAGRALDLRQPVVRALAWKISVPADVVGVAFELGGRGRGLQKAPCEESERSLDKASHWVFTFGSFPREIRPRGRLVHPERRRSFA